MQIILNGAAYPAPSRLGLDAVWAIIERLEVHHGWRRVACSETVISLEK